MKRLLVFAAIGLLGGMMVVAADNPVPAVDAARLTAFMEKWETRQAFNYPTNETDRPLLLAALAKDPSGPWAGYLDSLASDARFRIRQVNWEERKVWATSLLETLQQAEAIRRQMQSAGVAVVNPPQAFVFERGNYPETIAFLSLEAGRNLAAIKSKAQHKLAEVQATNPWYDGDAVYAANETLGRVALREGDTAAARDYLRAASRVTGSPALNSFGPDFLLARELLVHGTPADRDAVVAFLDDVAKFWANPDQEKYQPYREDKIRRRQDIENWKELIRAGKIPDDHQWR